MRGAVRTALASASESGGFSAFAAVASWSRASGITCAGKRYSETLTSARASCSTGSRSIGGTDECPPVPRVESRKLLYVFSATDICTTSTRERSVATKMSPPSLSASSASIRSRWFFTSHCTPSIAPVSSAEVSATITSRDGFLGEAASSSATATMADAIALSSVTPRAVR